MDCRRDLPESVLFDILIFLPVASLLRFKTVCKLWCSIIESSSFIRQRLNHNSEQNNLIVQDNRDQVFILSGRKHELCENLNLEGMDPDFHIVGSCNGIICVGYYESFCKCWCLSLWNPATKQVRKLPELSYFSPRKTRISHGFALVFDTNAYDYKIVSVSVDEHGETLNESLVQVYNMRTDSWRTIYEGCDFPIRRICYIDAECKSEMCLWTGYPSTGNTMVIFYFDLTKEAYGIIPLPDDHIGLSQRALTFVKDKVTYMEWNYGTGGRCYEIWRMDEFGIKESWKKLYKLKDPFMSRGVADVLYLSKNEDFFLVCQQKVEDPFLDCNKRKDVYELYAYYFARAEVKKLDVLNAYMFKDYTESLVSVKSCIETGFEWRKATRSIVIP